MKWMKHDSDAHRDVRMRKLRRQHGLEGVGLYWTILEMIVANVDEDRFTFELEEDSELIAEDVGVPRDRVEAMMQTMIELGLFECSDGVITCFKLLRRMDSSQVKSKKLRTLITEGKKQLEEGHDRVMTGSCRGHDRREEKRREEKGVMTPVSRRHDTVSECHDREGDANAPHTLQEVKKPKRFKPPTVNEVNEYVVEKGYGVNPQRFVDHYTANGWKVGKNSMKDWKAAVRTWASRDQAESKKTGYNTRSYG